MMAIKCYSCYDANCSSSFPRAGFFLIPPFGDPTEMTIKHWAADDRPREKLFNRGEEVLSDAELLAVLLRTGVKGKSALDLARTLIQTAGSLRQLSGSLGRPGKIKGLGEVKTAQIRAAIELGRRICEQEVKESRPQVQSARDVVQLLKPRMQDLKIEVFKVVYLNSQNRVIAIETAAQGTVNQVVPFIREILHKALTHYASAIVCVHNHPSGNCFPSAQDRDFTKYLKKSCDLMGIRLVDHLIITEHAYCSVPAKAQAR